MNWPATATFTSLRWVSSKLVCSFMLLAGIKPMWEDEANKFGGKWIVRLRKGGALNFGPGLSLFFCQVLVPDAGRTWCWQCLASSSWLGRRSAALLSPSGSRRTSSGQMMQKFVKLDGYFSTLLFSIWNRTACDQAVTNRIRDTFRRV